MFFLFARPFYPLDPCHTMHTKMWLVLARVCGHGHVQSCLGGGGKNEGGGRVGVSFSAPLAGRKETCCLGCVLWARVSSAQGKREEEKNLGANERGLGPTAPASFGPFFFSLAQQKNKTKLASAGPLLTPRPPFLHLTRSLPQHTAGAWTRRGGVASGGSGGVEGTFLFFDAHAGRDNAAHAGPFPRSHPPAAALRLPGVSLEALLHARTVGGA